MSIPATYTNRNETGCCAVPQLDGWDRATIDLSDQHFIRLHTRSVLHMPLNMAKVMASLQETAAKAESEMPPEHALILSRDLSPWRAEQLYSVSRPVEGADNVVLRGTFATRVYEGSYSEARAWVGDITDYVHGMDRTSQEIYFFYTTCPACAKHYGKNYVIALARLDEPASVAA